MESVETVVITAFQLPLHVSRGMDETFCCIDYP